MNFLLGPGLFSGAFALSFRECSYNVFKIYQLSEIHQFCLNAVNQKSICARV